MWFPMNHASQPSRPCGVSLPTWGLGLATWPALANGTLASVTQNGSSIRVCTRELAFLVSVVLDAPSRNQASMEPNRGHMKKNGSPDWRPPLSTHSPARTTGQSCGCTILRGEPSVPGELSQPMSHGTEMRCPLHTLPKWQNHEQINNCGCFRSLCLGSLVVQR